MRIRAPPRLSFVEVMVGEWHNNALNGMGTCLRSDGNSYEGEWRVGNAVTDAINMRAEMCTTANRTASMKQRLGRVHLRAK